MGIICWFLPLFCYVSGLLISSLGEEIASPDVTNIDWFLSAGSWLRLEHWPFIAKNEFRHPMLSRNKAFYLGTGGNEKKEVLVEFGEWLLDHIQYPIP